MSDVTLASLLVRVGADASSYMTTTSKVRTHTAQTFGALRGIARGFVDEMKSAMGTELPASVLQASKAMEYFGIAAQTMTNKLKWTSDVTKLSGAQLASFAEGAYRAGSALGTAIRPAVEQLTGLDEWSSKAASSHEALVAKLTGSADAYEEMLALYDRMRVKLRLVGEEWQISSGHTAENANRLAILTESAIAYSKAINNTPKKVDEFTRAMLASGRAIQQQQLRLAEGEKGVGEFIKRLAEMNDVVEDKDPIVALGSLMEQFKLLAASGEYSAQALLTAFGPRVKELDAELARLGISLPLPFKEFINALEGPGSGLTVLEHFIKGVREEIPDAQAIATRAMKSGFEDVRSSIRDARGDLTALGTDLENLSKEVVIKIKVDDRDLQEWRRRNGGGGEPNTGGQVP